VELGQDLADKLILPTAVINYTLSTKEDPSLVHPVHVKSAGLVVKHILSESELSHIQRFSLFLILFRFIIIGHSAGAHLGSLLVINSDFLDLVYRERIVGMVGVEGIYNINGLYEKFGHIPMYKEMIEMAFTDNRTVFSFF
jgi:hypothetical protein